MDVCPNCGEKVTGQKFCPNCGTQLVAPEGPAQSSAEEAAAQKTEPIQATPTAPQSQAAARARALFTAVPGAQYGWTALQSLIVYVAAWLVALIVAVLVIVGIALSGSSSSAPSGGANPLSSGSVGSGWSWLFGAPAQFIGLAVGGVLHLSVGILGASAQLSVLFLPLFITAVIIVATVLVSTWDERRARTASRGIRWLLAALFGVVFAVVAVVIAAISAPVIQAGNAGGLGTSLSVHAAASTASFSLFLGALVIVVLSSYLARARVAALRVGNVGAVRGLVQQIVRATIPVVFLYVCVVAVVVALAAVIGVIARGGADTLWSALLWLPTLAVDGVAFVNLVSIDVSGSASSLYGASGGPTSFWMPTAFPAWLTIVVIVLNLALIVAIAVVLRRRRGNVAGAPATWAVTIITFGLVGALISLIGGAALWTSINAGSLGGVLGQAGSATGSTLSALGQLQLFVGPAVWAFLVFGLLGAIVEAIALWVVPVIAPRIPAGAQNGVGRMLARVGVPMVAVAAADVESAASAPDSTEALQPDATTTEPAATPMTAEAKRRLRIIGIVVGSVIVVVVLAVIAVSVLTSTVFSPNRQVQSYLGDVKAGNARGAVATANIPTDSATSSLLTDRMLSATPARVTGYTITESTVTGSAAQVTAKVQQHGVTSTVRYGLTRSGTQWLFFPIWKMDAVQLPQVNVQVGRGIPSLKINGLTVALSAAQKSAGSVSLPAFPGTYQVGVGGSTEWLTATPRTVAVSASSVAPQSPVSLELKPTAAFTASVADQVKTFLSGCAAQATLEPANCPFEEFDFGTPSAITWAVTAQPQLELSANDDGTYAVRSSEPGHVTVSYTDSYFGTSSPETDDQDVYLDGTVAFVGGKPVFTYNSDF
jgi:hypothetical protein